jgi:hypothetical protein
MVMPDRTKAAAKALRGRESQNGNQIAVSEEDYAAPEPVSVQTLCAPDTGNLTA